ILSAIPIDRAPPLQRAPRRWPLALAALLALALGAAGTIAMIVLAPAWQGTSAPRPAIKLAIARPPPRIEPPRVQAPPEPAPVRSMVLRAVLEPASARAEL